MTLYNNNKLHVSSINTQQIRFSNLQLVHFVLKIDTTSALYVTGHC